ncbi:hypothetical protein PV342_37865 [Streptomyces sp. PA03-3a]|nr:hypothetical protein [Streptomyces sp. PA03-3a]
MSIAVMILLGLAGVSEAAGRIVPLAVRRPGMPRSLVAGSLLGGGLVESAVFALWPLTAATLAELALSAPAQDAGPVWTGELAAPLMLAGILAFPWLGPFLHLVLFVGVGAGLAGPLAAATGIGWWDAAGCVAVAGAGLGLAVEAVRRLVIRISATEPREAMA